MKLLFFLVLFTTISHCFGAEDPDDLLQFIIDSYAKPCEAELNAVKTCLHSVASNLNISESYNMFLDKELMISVMEEFENSTCFGPSECANVKVAKYVYDAVMYIGFKVYKQGFGCIENTSLEQYQDIGQHCVNLILISGQIKARTIDSFIDMLKPMVQCMVPRLACTDTEKNALFAASYRGIDLVDGFIHPEKLRNHLQLSESDISNEEIASALNIFS
ncbi:hypothetical protein B9Z55_025238 [Caenorhabditis nigoni]|uniref:DUF19 domain-containing protein n=1 Tax=Caenorhabditis nigoni TaxID=1611254 RepID=A0A2G5SXV2_9PELO|nr:hypothetical protein B9Z55_025238 [Caenorhabditis nigoni]